MIWIASERNKLKKLEFEIWCELVHNPNGKSFSSGKAANHSATQAQEHLQNCLKKRERRRSHQLSNKVTNLRRTI